MVRNVGSKKTNAWAVCVCESVGVCVCVLCRILFVFLEINN